MKSIIFKKDPHRMFKRLLQYGGDLGYSLPSDPTQEQLKKLIRDARGIGAIQESDLFFMFATDGDADFSCINIKEPGKFTAIRKNGIPLNSKLGYKGNGTTHWLIIPYTMETDRVNPSPTDYSGTVYVYDVGTQEWVVWGCGDNTSGGATSPEYGINRKPDGGLMHFGPLRNSSETVIENPFTTGTKTILYESANGGRTKAFSNGVLVNDYAWKATPLPYMTSRHIGICAGVYQNGDEGTFFRSNVGVSSFMFGAPMTEKQSDIHSIISNYINSI